VKKTICCEASLFVRFPQYGEHMSMIFIGNTARSLEACKMHKKLVEKPIKGLNDLGADGEIMLKYFLYNIKDMKLYR
jgi:hypothetical protein